ncbi:MAG: hypothetical protein JXR76_05355 [Deltaproteobacteria bacterium]|nr:hypothetical protein [Deltaproteobacteria bacterium]
MIVLFNSMLKNHCALLFIILFTAVSARANADANTQPDASSSPLAESTDASWSILPMLRIGAFEDYPKVGLSADALYHLHARFRLGGRLTFYFPRQFGNVVRNAGLLSILIQGILIDTRFVDWTMELAPGFGFFHDDYLKVYNDVSRLAPGFTLSTGVEVSVTRRIHPWAALGASLYFPDDISDSQWMELLVGIRLLF